MNVDVKKEQASTLLFLMMGAACNEPSPMSFEVGVPPDLGHDAGVPGPVDQGPSDMGEFLDTGPISDGPFPFDAGPDAGPDLGDPGDLPLTDVPVPPDLTISVSGRTTGLGAYLAQNETPVGQVSVLAFGVEPLEATVSSNIQATLGQYTLELPANGQAVLFANRAGFVPSYTPITTPAQNVQNQRVFIAESDWLQPILAAYTVDTQSFPCQTASLTGESCVWAGLVGRIEDDGAAGAGQIAPVAGVSADDFQILGQNNAPWAVQGPYFLTATGTASVSASTSQVDGANGGLYIAFVEVPQLTGPQQWPFEVSIQFADGVQNRYFGPVRVSAFRAPPGSPSIAWAPIRETGLPPAPQPGNIDFDSQIYPMFAPVNEGGLGCQGCHSPEGGPAGGMNLVGQDTAYASLDPALQPTRVNIMQPASSLLLQKPLYEPDGPQDHPIFAFVSDTDPSYQLVLSWITEGAPRNAVNLPTVSFAGEIQPLLANPSAQGGAGCYACHVQGVDANTAPGGLYLGGGATALHASLTTQTATDNGQTGETVRVNAQAPDRSLLLINPLFGHPEPHPVKVFSGTADPRYQLIYRWISEGFRNN